MSSLSNDRVHRPANPKPPSVPPVSPRPAALCALWIPDRQGNRWAYEVTRLDPDRRTGVLAAYRLHKACTDTTYTVALTQAHGAECECGDFLYRRDGQDPNGCKHIQALRKFGMLPELPPAKPAALASVVCPVCLGERTDPFDPAAWCIACGGVGQVPDDRPDDPPYTPEDLERLAGLIAIDLAG